MIEKEIIIKMFSDIMHPCKGIEGLFTNEVDQKEIIFGALSNIEHRPLTKVQLDQMLMLNYTKGMSNDFFKYYWLDEPDQHFYKVNTIQPYSEKYKKTNEIESLEQLKWGFYRLFVDLLFAFGNINMGYEKICGFNRKQLETFFGELRIGNKLPPNRSKTIKFDTIPENDKYLISEMACKTLATDYTDTTEFEKYLLERYKRYRGLNKKGYPSLHTLLSDEKLQKTGDETLQMSLFDNDDFDEKPIEDEKQIKRICHELSRRYVKAKESADKNTKLYLSLVADLDIYVATSMRTKDDFLKMSQFCKEVFEDKGLAQFDLRYFDPTISSTNSHEDKGLIECLMVKSAKALIYNAGTKESFGKDVEAAMALSLGKPVIFYCNENERQKFYKNVHPLSRLINMKNGVACGVIVCSEKEHVKELLNRLFSDSMIYFIDKKEKHDGYYLLKETLTGSVVRVETDDMLISSSFWNYYDTLGKKEL